MTTNLADLELIFSESGFDNSSIDDTRDNLRRFVDFMRAEPWQAEQIEAFAQLRQLKVETLVTAQSFMFPEEYIYPRDFATEDLWLRPFEGRYIYPVLSPLGKVCGLVGYDNGIDPKYLDGKQHGYKAKETMLYGMERIGDYYTSSAPVLVVEGVVCALVLRENGFNALALLGSSMTQYVSRILKRFGHRLIVIPDSDEAGAQLAKQVKRNLPEAQVYQSPFAKDVDDSRLTNPNFLNHLERNFNHGLNYECRT